ncbi:MAG: hypothetical protein SWI22_03220 [Pseudomonadota bacterium]|nr:hypothetical protein [Pseudomonadota bacterium]
MAQPVDERAFEVFDALVARAFGIDGGYLELNGIVSAQAAAGYNMFEDLGLSGSPMKLVVPALRKALQARGEAIERSCLEALFVGLPGNFELRAWIGRHCPTMLARVPETTFEAARAAYEKDRMERRVRAMSISLTALGPGIHLLPEQKALGHRMLRKLDELNDYKAIHEALHGLQGKTLLQLEKLSGNQTLPMERRVILEVHAGELRLAAEQIAWRFAGPNAPAGAVESRALAASAIEGVVDLLEQSSQEARETPEAVAGVLRAVLRPQMALFASRIVATAEEVPFTEFAAMLAGLPQAAGAPPTGPRGDPILAANVGSSFRDLKARLDLRVTVHTLWQEVEATLLNVEELLRGSGREIELRYHWRNLSDRLERMIALNAEHDPLDLNDLGEADPASADFGALVRSESFRTRFDSFARLARLRFAAADNDLFRDCKALDQLQQPLHILVGD